MSYPIVTLRLHWWERQLVKTFGREIRINGRFAGWIYRGKIYV